MTTRRAANTQTHLQQFNNANIGLMQEASQAQFYGQAPGAPANGASNGQAAVNAYQAALNKQTILATSTISELEQDLDKQELAFENLTEKHEELKTELANLKAQFAEMGADLAKLQKDSAEQIKKLTEDNEALTKKTTDLEGQVATLGDDKIQLEKDKTDLQAKLTKAEQDVADLSKDANEGGAASLGLGEGDKGKGSEKGDTQAATQHLSAEQAAKKAKEGTPGSPEAMEALLKSTAEKNREFKANQRRSGTTASMKEFLTCRNERPEGGGGKTNHQLVEQAIKLGL